MCEAGLSELRACGLAHIGRSSYRYRPRPPEDEALAERLRDYSGRHNREGYRKAHAWLRAQGERANHKRVERIWRREGLCVPKRKRRRRQGKSAQPRPERAERPGHVWTVDFMEDSCVQGRKLRILNVVDEFTRECLGADVARSFPAARAAQVFERLAREHGAPEFIRSDNGTEFVAKAMETWRENMAVQSLFIDPGKPWQNGLCESFNSRLRDECLNMEIFYGVHDAQASIDGWRKYYNQERPHGALDYQSPLAFKRQWIARQAKTDESETGTAPNENSQRAPSQPGALPPRPQDLPHCTSKQKGANAPPRNAKSDAKPDAALTASSPATALRSLPSGALPSVRTKPQYYRAKCPATKTIDGKESSHSQLS